MTLASWGRTSCASSLKTFYPITGNYSIVYTEADSKGGNKLRRESRTTAWANARTWPRDWKETTSKKETAGMIVRAHRPKPKLSVWRVRALCSILLSFDIYTTHLESTVPREEAKTYLKPLISVGEVQHCLERTWRHTFTLKDNDVTVTDNAEPQQVNANHWGITKLRGSLIKCLSRVSIFAPDHQTLLPESSHSDTS